MGVDLVAIMLGTNAFGRIRLGRQLHVDGTLSTTDNSGLIIGVIFPSLAIVTVVTVLRILVRKTLPPNRLFQDDAWVVVAAVLTVALCIVSVEGAKHGLGQHEWNLANHDSEVGATVMLMWAGQIIYSFAISAAKISIISSYFRIFPHKRFHQVLWVVLAVTVAFLIASIVATIFICRPVSAAWDPSVRTPMSCYRFIDVLYANAIVNVATDIILCTAPLPYFLKLRLPLKQKIVASLLFIIGGLAAVASLVRLSGLYEISPDGRDITYTIAEPLVWSVLECTISIVCISIPSMRPLFAKAAPSVFPANMTEDHDNFTKRISRRLSGMAAAARHPRKSMMIVLPPKPSLGSSSSSSSSSANSAFSSQRQLQLIPSFEKIETPLGSTETVVISMREFDQGELSSSSGNGGGEGRRGEHIVFEDEEAAIEGRDRNTRSLV